MVKVVGVSQKGVVVSGKNGDKLQTVSPYRLKLLSKHGADVILKKLGDDESGVG